MLRARLRKVIKTMECLRCGELSHAKRNDSGDESVKQLAVAHLRAKEVADKNKLRRETNMNQTQQRSQQTMLWF